MEELLKNVQEKTGLSMDQARSAITAVLGFIRGKLPQQAASQFDSALTGLGQSGKLPAGAPDMAALAEKVGLGGAQAGSLVETVLAFLKEKLPADLVTQITNAMATGVLGGIGKKVAAMFGKS
jgi:uncharacterized protein (DUF2267 family)